MEDKDEPGKLSQEQAFTELRSIIARAKKGDASVVPRLREYFANTPLLWRHCGDLAQQSQAAWVKLIAGDDKHLQECLVAKVNAMKMELANESTPLLENLLVERVVCSWLQLYYQEIRQAQQSEDSLQWAEFRLKQANAACDRHTKAIGALATMRKLLRDEGSQQGQIQSLSSNETVDVPPVVKKSDPPAHLHTSEVSEEQFQWSERNRIAFHLEAIGKSTKG